MKIIKYFTKVIEGWINELDSPAVKYDDKIPKIVIYPVLLFFLCTLVTSIIILLYINSLPS